MKRLTVLSLGVLGQALPATVWFKTMLQYSGGVLTLVVQKTLIDCITIDKNQMMLTNRPEFNVTAEVVNRTLMVLSPSWCGQVSALNSVAVR